MSKTRKEIIDETWPEYTLHARAKDGHDCLYLAPNGLKCALGRCMIAPQADWGWTASRVPDLEGKLMEEYRGHPVQFWSDLQELHDRDFNWDAAGLSEVGEKYVEMLHKEWDEVETCLA